jgi:hypothetical protein
MKVMAEAMMNSSAEESTTDSLSTRWNFSSDMSL